MSMAAKMYGQPIARFSFTRKAQARTHAIVAGWRQSDVFLVATRFASAWAVGQRRDNSTWLVVCKDGQTMEIPYEGYVSV